MALPDASTKLRMVLDYVPCEACLAQPVDDQDLLCGVCARLDRQVAVRVGTRTTILVEKPAAPEAPIIIPPAPEPAPEPAPAPLREIVVRFAEEAPVAKPGSVEVVVEPLAPPVPLVATVPVAPEPPLLIEEEPAFDVDDIATFTKARDEFFDFKKAPLAATAPLPPPEPRREAQPEPERLFAPPPEAQPPQDDFVFRPPAQEEPARAPVEEPPVRDDIIPEEEVLVESPREEQERWAPPSDFLAEEEPQPAPSQEAAQLVEEEILEMEPVEDEPIEMEIVPEDEEVVEMELVPEDETPPPPSTGAGDLYRLRGFDANAEAALAKVRIHELAHLSGHDAGELAERTGLPQARLVPWVQVADLVHDVGVPVDAAVALVAAGVAGPKGLRDADPDEVADRATAFGGSVVQARDVKRWKRRA